MKKLFTISILFSVLFGFSQNWTEVQQKNTSERSIKVKKGKQFSFSANSLLHHLPQKGESSLIQVPLPNGEITSFQIEQSEVLPDNLIQQYGLHAYKGFNTRNPAEKIRLEYNPENGFHAMISSEKETIFIDPYTKNNSTSVSVYNRKDFVENNKPKIKCSKHVSNHKVKADYTYLRSMKPLTTEAVIKTNYRIAIASTKEYTNFHGGTKQQALSAITTTLNRVSGIYESEASVTFTLVSNNDQIIFTNSNTGNLNNNDANTLINQSQTTIDNIIGSANYDIGHTVSTGAGGLAGLGVVCTLGKAQGVTGSPNPINDPYDVDYVCHEIGHQFGCNHTFNTTNTNCFPQINQATAVEPGSGITIMAYAGLCGADNIANNSIPNFHNKSLEQLNAFITNGAGKNCGTRTTTTNHSPVITINTTKYTIPKSTPFELTGSSTDQENDNVVYSWEQVDVNTSANTANNPSNNSPLFMSLATTASPTRTFPKLNDLLNGTTTYGEILPTYTRSMTFRLTARDQKGGVDFKEVQHNVDGNSGPFKITSQNSTSTKTGNSSLTITWDVANTNNAPVNCTAMDVLFSNDGGLTFTQTLLSATPNNGSAVITLPNINTNSARIKLKATNNIFFDVNDANFTIQKSTQPEFSLKSSETLVNLCATETNEVTITSEAINNFNGMVNLALTNVPNGVNTSFQSSTITADGTTKLTISKGMYTGSDFNITVKGTSGSITKTETIAIVIKDFPETFTITSPTSNDVLGSTAEIKWNTSNRADHYNIVFNNNPSLNKDKILTTNHLVSGLAANTQYMFTVKAENLCGITSVNHSFTTSNCKSYIQNTPTAITSGSVTTSSINVTDHGIVQKIGLTKLKGTHSWVGDVTIKLKSPKATSSTVFQKICNDNQYHNFDLKFNDHAPLGNIPCPPTNGGTYRPVSPFSTFNSEQINGNWLLELTDDVIGDDGTLDAWNLEICFSPAQNIYNINEEQIISLYPNPAQNSLNINGTNLANTDITISNVQGVLLIEQQLNESGQIDISQLSQGLYFVRINNQTISFVKK